jgi:prepilin-type N-terminal cleavage/methylation domain-containing protein
MGLAHAPTPVISPQSFPRPARRSTRGFTLIELVAVVLIIAIVAALAMPSIASRMRDRRTQQEAQTIAQLYATARMRAMGRGAAMMVRYNGTTGVFQMLEGIVGTAVNPNPNCDPLPTANCIGKVWDATDSRPVTTFDPRNRSEFTGVQVAFAQAGAGGAVTSIDVCFTPMGSAFVGYDGGGLQRLSGIPTGSVWRIDSASNPVGLRRSVLILPNGNSYLGVAQ